MVFSNGYYYFDSVSNYKHSAVKMLDFFPVEEDPWVDRGKGGERESVKIFSRSWYIVLIRHRNYNLTFYLEY